MRKANQTWKAYEPPQELKKSQHVIDEHKVNAAELFKKYDEAYSTENEVREDLHEASLFTWGPSGKAADSCVIVGKTEGIYLWDMSGKKYIDFMSQAMCVNLGHSCPKNVIDAVAKQMGENCYTWPLLACHQMKAKASKLLADIMPGDLNYCFFTSAGAESNESAIRMARRFTGKQKIISYLRSYHGGTLMASAVTGEPRRQFGGYSNDVIHVVNPHPLTFEWGKNEEEQTKRSLQYLREVIERETPGSIAAIILETVVGTNGILVPPKGYLNGIRDICDHYGILMIADEVMAGWGRSGKLFGFMHSDPIIIPDIVSLAKGLTSSYLPLGAVVVRDEIGKYFMKEAIGIGSTYSAHPVSLACMAENLRNFFEKDILSNVAAVERKMIELMNKAMEKHQVIKQCRSAGAFGMVDLQTDSKGTPFAGFLSPPPQPILEFKKLLKENGLLVGAKGSSFYCNPPLIITEEELEAAWAIIEKGLCLLDKYYRDV